MHSDETVSQAKTAAPKREASGPVRGTPKGRRVDPQARADVRALLGGEPRRRDLLIEHLHKIQDRYGHLAAAHLVALADEMKMAMAEVFEVATFYHHFDVVKEGDTAPPAVTVRVCDSLSCELAGAHALLEVTAVAPRRRRARAARALCRPLRDRAGGHRRPEPGAARDGREGKALVDAGPVAHPARDEQRHPDLDVVTPGHVDYAAYREDGGYTLATACAAGNGGAPMSSRCCRTRGCAAWAAPASRPAASGSSCRPSRRRD